MYSIYEYSKGYKSYIFTLQLYSRNLQVTIKEFDNKYLYILFNFYGTCGTLRM